MKILRPSVIFAMLIAMTLGFATDTALAQRSFGSLFDGRFAGGKASYVIHFSERYSPGTIVASFGDRRLYFVIERGRAVSYPIGVPAGNASWSGTTYVSSKRENPSWTPTANMRRENPTLPTYVPGGDPKNPLGVRAMYLGDTLYRIHGTDAPWTIGRDVTHGCIRLHNRHVIDLYNRTRVGARVVVTKHRIVE